MNLEEYQTIIEKTAIYPKEIGLAYCALGLTGEAGEVAEKVKKIYRDEGGKLSGHKAKQIALEVSDVLWYCTAMANELGYTLEEILKMNYEKLIKRRETNTIHGDGDDRQNVND